MERAGAYSPFILRHGNIEMKYKVIRGINYKEKRFEPDEIITSKSLPKTVIKTLLAKKALIEIKKEE